MRIAVLAVSTALSAAPAFAQVGRPAHQTGGGYSYLRYRTEQVQQVSFVKSTDGPLRGYYLSDSERTPWRWDLTIEVSSVSGTHRDTATLPGGTVVIESPIETSALVAGPRYSFRRGARLSPFLRALAGLADGFCVQAGGGVDVHLTGHLGIRAGADYRGRVADAQSILVAQGGLVISYGR